MSHNGYRGMEVRLTYDLMSDQYTFLCYTDTNGSVENFLMINSTRPTVALPKDRFSIPFGGIATFVRSSCLKKLATRTRLIDCIQTQSALSKFEGMTDWHCPFYMVKSTQPIQSYRTLGISRCPRFRWDPYCVINDTLTTDWNVLSQWNRVDIS